MKIVVPMAGKGSRFLALADKVKEYAYPKPMIPVLGKPMVKWAMESYKTFLQLDRREDKEVKLKDLIFICLKEHEDRFSISKFLINTFSQDIKIIFTERLTHGPAQTVLLAKDFINSSEDVIISDCDHHFDASPLWESIVKYRDCKYIGILPVMRPQDTTPSWSYVIMNSQNEVLDIREKDIHLAQKRAWGVIGAYYFKEGRIFVEEASRMVEEKDKVGNKSNPEFYISRVYQRLIKKGNYIIATIIKKGFILGTPKQLDEFVELF